MVNWFTFPVVSCPVKTTTTKASTIPFGDFINFIIIILKSPKEKTITASATRNSPLTDLLLDL